MAAETELIIRIFLDLLFIILKVLFALCAPVLFALAKKNGPEIFISEPNLRS